MALFNDAGRLQAGLLLPCLRRFPRGRDALRAFLLTPPQRLRNSRAAHRHHAPSLACAASEHATQPILQSQCTRGRGFAPCTVFGGVAPPQDSWHDWASGQGQLVCARRTRGTWEDGAPLGRGFGQPSLQSEYARLIASGAKTMYTVEGRGGLYTERSRMVHHIVRGCIEDLLFLKVQLKLSCSQLVLSLYLACS